MEHGHEDHGGAVVARILYLSCHAILEYDELVMFTRLAKDGHDLQVLSLGSYVNPANPMDDKRPAIEGGYDNEAVSHMIQGLRDKLTSASLKRFDAVLVMHKPEWVVENWPIFREWGKPVIWRSIGQSIKPVEDALRPMRNEGLVIVRYSPREARIPGYIGHDAIIRFVKDPDEWNGWNGESEHVAIVGQRIRGRGAWCNAGALDTITHGLPRVVYGPDNDDWNDEWGGMLSYEGLKQAMRDARCLVYGGTVPASYTLVLAEAMMTGLPVVSVGPRHMHGVFPDHQTFEVPDIIEDGVNGYCSDNVGVLRRRVAGLLNDHDLARRIGEAGRETAIGLFDSNKVRLQWLELFRGLELL